MAWGFRFRLYTIIHVRNEAIIVLKSMGGCRSVSAIATDKRIEECDCDR